ncbi:uncharacterized protein [Rutidosis leptorrhynchoides]|uniref:uncharacterized protein n=1 Tax=Rutidosis leptorrhynchoides TaxID=125765 RepID=UPI003A99B89F
MDMLYDSYQDEDGMLEDMFDKVGNSDVVSFILKAVLMFNITPGHLLIDLYTDGAASSEGTGAGLILTGPYQEEHTYALRFNFKVTNNEAEYEALLAGTRIAQELGVNKLQAYEDSQLVANQVNGTFDANDKSMQSYLALVHSLADTFVDFRISQIPRSQNKQADVFSKLAALTFNHLEKKILVEQVFKKSTELETTIASVEEEEATWMTDIMEFLQTGSLPEGEKEAMKIKVKAPNYELRGEIIYQKSYLGASLRCVGPKETAMIIDEVHKGSCGLHSGWSTVTERIKRLGYYWPRMYADTAERIRICQECQLHAPGTGNTEYLVVAIDFFTKWVEAKPLRTITSKQIRDFFWESIVCRFGVPNEIVSDNEAVIPAEITVQTKRILSYGEDENGEILRTNLNYAEERREMAAIQEAANKQRIAKYYNKRVRARTYKVGDLVWHDNQESSAQNTGKLGPNWEGPYKVIGISNT